MKQATQVILKILEQRFGAAEAQALAFGRARLERKDVQFLDIKHMSELSERYRAMVRHSIRAYRLWRGAYMAEMDPLVRLYGAAEGAALHRRIGDDVKLWYFSHRDYHAMRREYLLKCMNPQARVNWDKAA